MKNLSDNFWRILGYSTLQGTAEIYTTHCTFGINHVLAMQLGSVSHAWSMQHESLELAATAYDTIDSKGQQLAQGTYHQEYTGIEEKNLKLRHAISIFDKPIFLEHICYGQHKCMEPQFQQLVEVPNVGNDISVQFHDRILCKLIRDYFTPVILHSRTLIQIILREYHTSVLQGYLVKAKLLS